MKPRIELRTYLPALFRAAEVNGVSFLSRFLNAFELLFEGMEAEIEGNRDPNSSALTGGGIPDLFNVASTPPSQFSYRPKASNENPDPDFDFLTYLASWIGVTLRVDPIKKSGEDDPTYFARRTALNRQYIQTAMALYPQRGTMAALDALLRAWLTGEMAPDAPPVSIVTDLRPPHTDATAVFQLGTVPHQAGATLGFDTVLGDGVPYLFIVDITLDPDEPNLRNPQGLQTVQRAARSLLDQEKPAHTYYQLCVRAHTMRLAAPGEVLVNGEPAAQIGATTLLWKDTWTYNSH